jgi:hypothetical protein
MSSSLEVFNSRALGIMKTILSQMITDIHDQELQIANGESLETIKARSEQGMKALDEGFRILCQIRADMRQDLERGKRQGRELDAWLPVVVDYLDLDVDLEE